MYIFLPRTYTCVTSGQEGMQRQKERERGKKEAEEEENGEKEPQMVANYMMLRVKVRTKELITAREMKCSPGKHSHFLGAFCLSEESGFRNNWKQSEVGHLIQRLLYLKSEAIISPFT